MNEENASQDPTLKVEASQSDQEPRSTQTNAEQTATWQGKESHERAFPLAKGNLPQIPGYEVTEFIAQGGMGMVVKARDLALGRTVAIKLPRGDRVTEKKDRDRFLREARAAAKFRHPNICTIHDVGEVGDLPYIVMDYIGGPTLTQWLKEKSPDEREIAGVVAELADAAQFAHNQGVLHRDIKPSNAMIDTATGHAVLMDFGLAKDLDPETAQLTIDGQVMGTPAYMPPEQAAGNQEKMGPSADVYAIGAVLYSLLSGKPPYSGSMGDVLQQVLTQSPTSLRKHVPRIHRDLETICLRAMAREPQLRYATAGELASDLRRFRVGDAILARREPWRRKMGRAIRRHPLTSALIFAAVVAIAIAGVVGFRAAKDRQRTADLQAFETALDQSAWSAAEIERLDRMAKDFSRYGEAMSSEAAGRITTQFAAYVQELTERSELDPDDLSAIESSIERLRQRDAVLGGQARRRLDSRLRSWITIFELKAPYGNLGAIFDERDVQKRPSGLIQTKSDAGSIARLSSKVANRGSGEMEAIFSKPSIIDERRVGIVLCSTEDDGYEFSLTAPRRLALLTSDDEAPASSGALSIADAVTQGVPLVMTISRSGSVVRSQDIHVEDEQLRFSASRVSGRLQFQVNREPPLEFIDPFPLSTGETGVFAVLWPRSAELHSLSAAYRALPEKPSKLESADYLYNHAQYAEALEEYRAQQVAGASNEVLCEARLKEALSLLALRRRSDAIDALQLAIALEENRWTIVASCYLWMVYVEGKQFDEADAVYETISRRYTYEELVAVLPNSVRGNIMRAYSELTSGTSLLSFNPERLRDVKRSLAIEKLLRGQVAFGSSFRLLRGYRASGHTSEAVTVAANLINDPRFALASTEARLWVIEEYCWLKRLQGRPNDAIEMLNRFENKQSPGRPGEYLPLLVERARCLVANGDVTGAAECIARLRSETTPGELIYRHHSAAALIEGYLHEDAGDHEAALQAWRDGLYRVWQPQRVAAVPAEASRFPPLPRPNNDYFSGMEMLQVLLLASLCEDLTDEEVTAVVRWMTFRQGNESVLSMVDGPLAIVDRGFVADSIRNCFRTPRGKKLSRDAAFQMMAFRDVFMEAVKMPVMYAINKGSFGDFEDPQIDQFFFEFVSHGLNEYQAGSITMSQVIQLGLTWKGNKNILGWHGLERTLDEELRSALALVFGRRFQRLGRDKEAAEFFQQAMNESAEDSLTRRLAIESIELQDEPSTIPKKTDD